MGCAHKENQDGFTLVEISIVMIIIGLLIGGTFGGMKLIENMQVNRTVQDLKAIESAALTFKDTYGRFPGDIVNPAVRLPNCTVAPCATGGNGNRQVGVNNWSAPILVTDETFTFWHHLQAADLLQMDFRSSLDLNFGEGQPSLPIGGGGYRMTYWGPNRPLGPCPTGLSSSGMFLTGEASADATDTTTGRTVPCNGIRSIDEKTDDGKPYTGRMISSVGCAATAAACNTDYSASGNSAVVYYDFKGF